MKKIHVFTLLVLLVGLFGTATPALARFGIDPGKVYIDNLYPGAEADVPITIYNHNDYATTFSITARQPDYTEEGYEPLPFLEWFTFSPEQVTIEANKREEVIVVLVMPEDAEYFGEKAEAWIVFREIQDTGDMIQVEIASRLLISTKAEEPMGPEAASIKPDEMPVKPAEAPIDPAETTTTQVKPLPSDGAIGITAGVAEVEAEAEANNYLWVVIVAVVATVGGTIILLAKKKRQT